MTSDRYGMKYLRLHGTILDKLVLLRLQAMLSNTPSTKCRSCCGVAAYLSSFTVVQRFSAISPMLYIQSLGYVTHIDREHYAW